MESFIPAQHKILEMADVLHWWSYKDACFWFTGSEKQRVKFLEKNLPKLVEGGELKLVKRGNKHFYSSWSQPAHLRHGLICSKSFLRIYAADKSGEAIGENAFRQQKFGVVPEWAIVYPNNTMLLFEYCTADNAGRNGLVVKKVNFYKKYLNRIEAHFHTKAIVVLVLDTIDALKHATNNIGASFAYFVDLKTFAKVKIGDHLKAPIYIWGGDGKKYPLKNDA